MKEREREKKRQLIYVPSLNRVRDLITQEDHMTCERVLDSFFFFRGGRRHQSG